VNQVRSHPPGRLRTGRSAAGNQHVGCQKSAWPV